MMHREFPQESLPAGGRAWVLLLAVAAISSAQAQAPAPVAGPASEIAGGQAAEKTRRAEGNFLIKAHAIGAREIKFSELAATRAVDPRVRTYAQRILEERQQMARELAPLVTAAGLDAKVAESAGPNGPSSSAAEVVQIPDDDPNASENLPPGVRGRWERMLNERKLKLLASKSGPEFDQAYLALMVDDQKGAADLFADGAEKTRAPVSEFAAKYLPRLRQHLEQAGQLQKSLK